VNLLDTTMRNRTRPPRAPRGLWAALLLLAVSLFTAIPALAQTGKGVITGRVIDAATKAPVADVVVTATSPALQGEQLVVTDGSGSFRIPNLPPGDYSLRLEKETYKPFSRGGIAMRSASTIRVNLDLIPESLKAEEIVVVGRAPTVDVGSTTTGQTITQDFTRRIAVAPPAGKGGAQRSFESVAEVAPGAHTDDYGTSINGTTSPENAYVIDGVSVNDPAYGIVGTPLSVEFVKEVNVVSGGYMPEFGKATGGVLDVVTKSGGNDFHGSVFFFLTPGALEGTREPVIRDGTTISTTQELGSIRDFGFEIGGPIVKDKLWFFAGMDIAFTTRNLDRRLNSVQGFDRNAFLEGGSLAACDVSPDPMTGQPILPCTGPGEVCNTDPGMPTGTCRISNPDWGAANKDPETGFTLTTPLDGTERRYKAESQTIQYIAKLTYQVNQDNSLALSVYGSPTVSGGNGAIGLDPQDGGLETTSFAGQYSALGHKYVASANDIALKWSSAFNNKKILFDATVGWHHQENGRLPSDGSELGSKDLNDLSAIPTVSWRRNTPTRHSIQDFESIPTGAPCTPEDISREVDGGPETLTLVPCPVVTYLSGGPDFIDEASQDRFQLRAILTSLFEGAGHHVVKGGLEGEIMLYDHVKAYSGRERFRESTGGTSFDDNRMYGFLTGPDKNDYVILDTSSTSSTSVGVGGFVQDSWSIMDKVTLNIGVRYDSQYLIGDDGTLGMALPNQWSPRVGVVYDFTQQGRSKVFANYARYYENVPLDVVDRQFGHEQTITSRHIAATCDPRDPLQATGPACQDDSNRREGILNGPHDPNQTWVPVGGAKSPIDPDISAQSSDEIVVGGEYELIQNGRLGVSYTKRWMNSVIEDMSRDEASTYFIGNPGQGIASDFPEAKRDYDAVTFYFTKGFSDLWLAQASYTISALRGNYAGLFRPETGQLDPNINSDFDLKSLTVNRDGTLPGDRTHEIKIFGAKSFEIPGGMALDLGLTFRTRSGGPTDFYGSHPIYGADEIFIVKRGSGDRLPWVHNIDGSVRYAFDLAKDSQLILSMDVFNIFNFQAVTQQDNRYTNADVNPCVDAETIAACPGGVPEKLDGTPFTDEDVNPNFGNPTAYQAPRTFRFGARVTF
jgi:hypothetical protein